MHSFSDNEGRKWLVRVNVGALRQVKAALDVNLLDVVGGKLVHRLCTDPALLCDILFVVCQKQAKENNVTDEEFGCAMGGDVLEEATKALLEEIVDFFPSEQERTALRTALQKAWEAVGQVREELVVRANTLSPKEIVDHITQAGNGLESAGE